MRYKITIEGGFTGIPKEYEGEINLEIRELKKVQEALRKHSPRNDKLRDGLMYHIELEDNSDTFKGDFDESNLPVEIRNFIENIPK